MNPRLQRMKDCLDMKLSFDQIEYAHLKTLATMEGLDPQSPEDLSRVVMKLALQRVAENFALLEAARAARQPSEPAKGVADGR